MHDERRLHADRGAVGGIDALEFPGDQAVGHGRHAGAAVTLDGGTQQADLAHFPQDRRVEVLVAVRLDNAGLELALGIVPGGIPDHAFVGRQLLVQRERVLPVEAGVAHQLSRSMRVYDGDCIR